MGQADRPQAWFWKSDEAARNTASDPSSHHGS
jgi:hypothetical protein